LIKLKMEATVEVASIQSRIGYYITNVVCLYDDLHLVKNTTSG